MNHYLFVQRGINRLLKVSDFSDVLLSMTTSLPVKNKLDLFYRINIPGHYALLHGANLNLNWT